MKSLHLQRVGRELAWQPRGLDVQLRQVLSPFLRYLMQAIAGARGRQQRHCVAWQAAPRPVTLTLTPRNTWIEVTLPAGGVQVVDWPSGRPYDQTRKLTLLDREDQPSALSILHVQDSPLGPVLTLDGPLPAHETALWCGVSCTLRVQAAATPPAEVIDSQGRALRVLQVEHLPELRVKLLLEGEPAKGPLTTAQGPLTARRLPSGQGLTRLSDLAGASWPAQLRRGQADDVLHWEVPERPSARELLGDNGVLFSVGEGPQKRGEDECVVQLLLPPDAAADGESREDPRAALCDEEPEVVLTHDGPQHGENEPEAYRVRHIRADTYQLVLDRLPKKDTLLYPVINTGNLEKQRRAIYRLRDAPLPHHVGLLRLCLPREAPWPQVAAEPTPPIGADGWFILRDAAVDGAREQRDFVNTTLAAPDLTVLEGPPGSGKTTVICELVLQLLLRGQRVLLCASTHAAIDNVLERLVGGRFPQVEALRIGHVDRVDPMIKQCVLTERVAALREALLKGEPALARLPERELTQRAERLLLLTTNLTCGTTMGILAHPALRRSGSERNEVQERRAAAPHFDVLIIDEASKTTTQEFLVPALLCRRWVIIGDVHQLPPFTERADLEANLAELRDERSALFPPPQQRARQLVARLLQQPTLRAQRFLITEDAVTLRWLFSELAEEDALPGPVAWVTSSAAPAVIPCDFEDTGLWSLAPREVPAQALRLLAAWLVLVAPPDLPAIQRWLPPNLLTLAPLASVDAAAPPLALALRRRRWLQQLAGPLRPPLRERGRVVAETPAQLEEHERAWLAQHPLCGELAWRLVRVHELRQSSARGERARLEQQIEALLPRAGAASEAREQIEAIMDLALPSVLEVLQQGVGVERSKRRSALTEGLAPSALKARFRRLTFQHRMHPDIAALPRELFYESAALLDAGTLRGRDARLGWSFASDQPRRAFLAVRGQEERGVNRAEVARMRQVVEAFLGWARVHAPPAERPWEVACLSFYLAQEEAIARMLQELLKQPRQRTRFGAPGVSLFCGVVDRFQGREADLVLLSLRNTARTGFLDSPNRLNVALTRARLQLVVVGHQTHFTTCGNRELEQLSRRTSIWRES